METILSLVHVVIYLALFFVPKDVNHIVIEGPSPGERMELVRQDGEWKIMGEQAGVLNGNLVIGASRIPMKLEFIRAFTTINKTKSKVFTMEDGTVIAKNDDGLVFTTSVDGNKKEYRIRYGVAAPETPASARTAQITINVLGEVSEPGIYKIRGDASLLDAVAAAGGWTKMAHMKKVSVLRGPAGSIAKVHFFDLDGILNGTSESPQLLERDTIYFKERVF